MEKNIKLLSILLSILLFTAVFLAGCDSAPDEIIYETGREDYSIVDGVIESRVYAVDENANNMTMQILHVDNDSNIDIKVNTANYYSNGSTQVDRTKKAESWTVDSWDYSSVGEQAESYYSTADTTGIIVAAINGDFYNKAYNGETVGNLVLEGNVIRKSDAEPTFVVLADGSCEIRKAGEDVDDVKEAVSGGGWLVKDGKLAIDGDKYNHPGISIGVTYDNDVVVVNVDTTNPLSKRTTLKNLAVVMKEQKCKKAIYLDGGGSATFMSKRNGDNELRYRNKFADGAPRNVSSSLLFINKSESVKKSVETTADDAIVSMKSDRTKLEREKDGTYNYCVNNDPYDGFAVVNGKTYLFAAGRGESRTIKIGDMAYTFHKGKLTTCSDENSGEIAIGYCGDRGNEKSLLYAYHYGDKVLNIGVNPLHSGDGRMMQYEDPIDMPWYVERFNIKSVVFGEGVVSISPGFLEISRTPFNDLLKGKQSALKTIYLPNSMHEIGDRAFYNNANLADVKIPDSVGEIGDKAFAYTKAGFSD